MGSGRGRGAGLRCGRGEVLGGGTRRGRNERFEGQVRCRAAAWERECSLDEGSTEGTSALDRCARPGHVVVVVAAAAVAAAAAAVALAAEASCLALRYWAPAQFLAHTADTAAVVVAAAWRIGPRALKPCRPPPPPANEMLLHSEPHNL
jgi:hypothetical protein